jgi:hypothetical protein
MSKDLSIFACRALSRQDNLAQLVETLKEFKGGMLWGQKLIVYIDHQNLIQDALGLTSDHV